MTTQYKNGDMVRVGRIGTEYDGKTCRIIWVNRFDDKYKVITDADPPGAMWVAGDDLTIVGGMPIAEWRRELAAIIRWQLATLDSLGIDWLEGFQVGLCDSVRICSFDRIISGEDAPPCKAYILAEVVLDLLR